MCQIYVKRAFSERMLFADNWWNTPKCFDPEHNSSEAYIKYHKEHNDTKTAVEEYWE